MTLSRRVAGRAKQFGESSIFINANGHVNNCCSEEFRGAGGHGLERLIA